MASEAAARVVRGQAEPADEEYDVVAAAVAAAGSPPARLDEPSLHEVAEILAAEMVPVPAGEAADEQRG